MLVFFLKACIQVCPKNPTNFNVDNVRVAKLLGGGLHNSCIVRGMVLKSDAVGSIKRMEKAKVRLLCCLLFMLFVHVLFVGLIGFMLLRIIALYLCFFLF